MKTRLLLVLLPLLALARQGSAAQVTLSASTLTATIAEHVELRLIVRSLENVDAMNVSLPAGDFEIIGRQNSPPIRTAEWRTFEQVLTIAFFKTGDFVVGPGGRTACRQDGQGKRTERHGDHQDPLAARR